MTNHRGTSAIGAGQEHFRRKMRDVLSGPGSPTGLTTSEAAERLAQGGPNELSSARRTTLLMSALTVVREPMSLLLVACGVIYVFLGDIEEALMLLGFVVFIMGITLFQERKTERALEALRDMASPRALVVRDGARARVAGRDVVVGDVVVLAEGDRVPADATVIESSHLLVDESLLTGESAPVRKSAWDGAREITRPGGEDLPFVYAATLVVEGSALARVHATGARAEIGRIGKSIEEATAHETPLQREMRGLVKTLAWTGAAISALAAIVFALTRGSLLGGVLAGLTLAMAILPNELPVVVAIFLALGAWRLSLRRVLTRRVPAIEALGSATVLCVDKTGTLTVNEMSVRTIVAGGAPPFDVVRLETEELPEEQHELVEHAILASRRDPFDPMERAFKDLGERYLAGTEHLHPGWTLLREYPLSRDLLAVAQVWEGPPGGELVVAAKGAPEAIVDLCHMDEDGRRSVADDALALAERGLRVLAVARGRLAAGALPDHSHDVAYAFLGLVGLADPIREDAPRAIDDCRAAGIRVVMITGDYPATASAVARELGLGGAIVTGAELEAHGAAALREAQVFARVLPEQKLLIVRALQAAGEVVAMTGDGVNDAPALRAADIGVAMGARGTDVAREAADLVLLDDAFATLVDAVRAGRRIVDNLRKALAYVLAVHVPIVGLTLAPVFAGWPLVLLPIHVAFLHLVIDPACSVVFEAEPEEPDVMKRPPRPPAEPLFGRRVLAISLSQGAVVAAVTVAVYAIALGRGQGELDSRAITFTTFLVANLGLIFANRSWTRAIAGSLRRGNRALGWVTGGAIAFLGVVLYVPRLRELFRFAPLHAIDLAIALGAGALSVGWFEVLKLFTRRGRRAGT